MLPSALIYSSCCCLQRTEAMGCISFLLPLQENYLNLYGLKTTQIYYFSILEGKSLK